MHEQVHHESIGLIPQLILLFPFLIGFIIYFLAIVISHQKQRTWPVYRTLFWVTGSTFAMIAVAGPLAERAHLDFTIHMLVHLLLGMLAPLLMVLAAPITLIVRALPVQHAKLLTKWLRSRFVHIISDSIVASILNIGGLWLLYTTDLFTAMHENMILYVVIHLHVFLAGYLFTISIIYIEPTAHRKSYLYRSIIMVLALAGHGILAKYMYANPPIGVPSYQAEIGSMLMYYGGDLVDLIIIFILCSQWYKETRTCVALKTEAKKVFLD
ncbi:cytochrome c oxidase assembly protein [Gracilibacillus sp. D59]|uniref:cytochrome c oxidase assembly protein n=1 Tax=Gracilibacillus sp. D59 TaxID=3457434 RepID=UPI003FCE31EF